eukprot:Skav235612  [mRNA]  locus=scaffold358:57220:57540:- [translate_table: standard]
MQSTPPPCWESQGLGCCKRSQVYDVKSGRIPEAAAQPGDFNVRDFFSWDSHPWLPYVAIMNTTLQYHLSPRFHTGVMSWAEHVTSPETSLIPTHHPSILRRIDQES